MKATAIEDFADSVIRCEHLQEDRVVEADVAIVGTGAGGGVTAEILAQAGLRVAMIEAGDFKTHADFHMQEAEAYPQLYQEVASRKTRDHAITILQGRTLGGSTTVNWTICFHIPGPTLDHWGQEFDLSVFNEEELAPWYAHMEKRLHVHPWTRHNASNLALRDGAKKLGWKHEVAARNVHHCRSLGYCGTGCPIDAKQSMLVTTIPAAMGQGAVLLTRCRADRLVTRAERVQELECSALDERGAKRTGVRVTVRAKHFVAAAGGIDSPALLLRSGVPDPSGQLGRRVFLHVTAGSAGIMPGRIDPFYGAPQSVYSNEFLWRDGVDGELGYKMETAPLQPVLAATAFKAWGQAHAGFMAELPFIQPTIALLRDGFHEHSPGGRVQLRDDGTAVLDYQLNDYFWRGARAAYASMAELQFAAGARRVLPLHTGARPYKNWKEAQAAIADLAMKPLHAQLFSAHVMGGCMMGPDEAKSVVDPDGTHHQIRNLSVIDGSLFPTSIGANPSMPIYAVAARQATHLAKRLQS
jgi:choline dehydrogenase-like flavoprotein